MVFKHSSFWLFLLIGSCLLQWCHEKGSGWCLWDPLHVHSLWQTQNENWQIQCSSWSVQWWNTSGAGINWRESRICWVSLLGMILDNYDLFFSWVNPCTLLYKPWGFPEGELLSPLFVLHNLWTAPEQKNRVNLKKIWVLDILMSQNLEIFSDISDKISNYSFSWKKE